MFRILLPLLTIVFVFPHFCHAVSPVFAGYIEECRNRAFAALSDGKKWTAPEAEAKLIGSGIKNYYKIGMANELCTGTKLVDSFKTKKAWKGLCPNTQALLKMDCFLEHLKATPTSYAVSVIFLLKASEAIGFMDFESNRHKKTALHKIMLAQLLILENYQAENAPLWTTFSRDPYFPEFRGQESASFQAGFRTTLPTLEAKPAEMAKTPLVAGETKAPGDLAIRDLNARLKKLKTKLFN